MEKKKEGKTYALSSFLREEGAEDMGKKCLFLIPELQRVFQLVCKCVGKREHFKKNGAIK